MTPVSSTIAVIDPAGRVAETDSYNLIARMSRMPTSYHLPGMFGLDSLSIYKDTDPAGVIVFGSSASVMEEHAWQRPLEAWLKPLADRGVPCLGLCYGHQMLAHMYGGRVEFRDPERNKLTGFRNVKVSAVEGLWDACEGPLVVSHREHVTTLPAELRVIATSTDCPVDGFRHVTLPIFGLQPHPEATPDFMRHQDIAFEETSPFSFGHRLVEGFLAFAAHKIST